MILHWGKVEKALADQIDDLFEVAEPSFTSFLMKIADEDLNLALMTGYEGIDVAGVELLCALSLWQDKIRKNKETDPAVEWEPADYEDGPRFDKEEQ